MKIQDLHQLTLVDLVERFTANCVEQGTALFDNDTSRFNRLYGKMAAIRDELKSRPGDQRSALLTLFDHRDIQVRLQAARAAFAIAPGKAREVIEGIAASHHYPQAGDAGMTLANLDRGVFVPN